jgi:hypothetical protein
LDSSTVRRSLTPALGLLVVVLTCGQIEETVPSELLGTWTTDHPLYRGRFMEFRPDRIYFGTGEGEPNANPVVSVRRQSTDGQVSFTVDYVTPEGGQQQLLLRYDPGIGELKLANRDQVPWRKRVTG